VEDRQPGARAPARTGPDRLTGAIAPQVDFNTALFLPGITAAPVIARISA
jgi:hypothetical protein